MPEKLNVHISFTEFRNESRLLKETASLVREGIVDRVLVVALGSAELSKYETIDEKRSVVRIKLATRKLPKTLPFQLIKYLEFVVQLLAHVPWKIDTLQVHSLDILPCGVALKLVSITRRLVYDAHELETECSGSQSKFRKWLARFVERSLIRHVDAMLVVNDAIADWYERQYSMFRPIVVHNIPVQPKEKSYDAGILREKFAINDSDLVFIYQGALCSGRGLELMLEAFHDETMKGKHLCIMGYGSLEQQVLHAAQSNSRIHFVPAVPPDKVLEITAGADVGLSLPEATCLNHQYCLPNKVFEYAIAGIPVIVSDFPVMGAFVKRFDAGWCIKPCVKDLRRQISSLTQKDILAKKSSVRLNCSTLGWHSEEKGLFSAYAQ